MRFLIGGLVGAVMGVIAFMILTATGASVAVNMEVAFSMIGEFFKYLGPPWFIVGGLHMLWIGRLTRTTVSGSLLKSAALGMVTGVSSVVLLLAWVPLISSVPIPLALFPLALWVMVILLMCLCGAVVGIVNGCIVTMLEARDAETARGRNLQGGLKKCMTLVVQGGITCVIAGIIYGLLLSLIQSGGTAFIGAGSGKGFIAILMAMVPYLFLYGGFLMLILGHRRFNGEMSGIMLRSSLQGLVLALYATSHFVVPALLTIVTIPVQGSAGSGVLEGILWIAVWGVVSGAACGWVHRVMNPDRGVT